MKAKAAGRLVIAAVLLCSCAVPAIADTRTEVGIFTAVAGGTHVGADNPPVSGLSPIAALDVRQLVGAFERRERDGERRRRSASPLSPRGGFPARQSIELQRRERRSQLRT